MRTAIFALLFSFSLISFSYAESGIELKDAWVRGTPPGSTITALYLNIENKGSENDVLLSASSDVSKVVELHTTSVDDKGVAKMEMLESISIPAGGTVKLEPGGMHIMLIDLQKPLETGENVEVELVFEKAGPIKAQAKVKGPGEAVHGHGHKGH